MGGSNRSLQHQLQQELRRAGERGGEKQLVQSPC